MHVQYNMLEEKIGHINSFFELEAEDIDKRLIKFDQFKGGVTVITNVASHCGKLYCFFVLHRYTWGEVLLLLVFIHIILIIIYSLAYWVLFILGGCRLSADIYITIS